MIVAVPDRIHFLINDLMKMIPKWNHLQTDMMLPNEMHDRSAGFVSFVIIYILLVMVDDKANRQKQIIYNSGHHLICVNDC